MTIDLNMPQLVYPRADAARRKKLPRQNPPRRHEEDYAGALVKIVRRTRHAYGPLLRALPGLLEGAAAARRGDRVDAGESNKIRQMAQAAAEASRRAIPRHEIDSLARKFAERTSTYQRIQLANQVRSALGVDPIFRDKGLAARVEHFTHENVALVTRIPERLHGDLESMVTRAVSSGRPHPALAEEIEERFGVAERHARLIARDQIGKFYAGVNHARQREMGVDKFVWRTAGDERVREEHAELDGEEFDYDDPPVVEGEEALPGEQIQCRCWAEPVLEELEDDDEPDDEDPDDTDE